MAFRDFVYPAVLARLGLTARTADLSAGASPVPARPEFAALFAECLAIAVPDLGVCTEKARSEFLIAPVLVELRRATGRRFSVFSGMELNVNRARGLNGACDYVLTKGDNQHLREAPIIGVLEAKNEDFCNQGLGQCVAGMYAAQLRDRSAGWAVARVFGACTTGRAWQFLSLDGAALTIDWATYRAADLGRLLGVLKHCVERASDAAPDEPPAGAAGTVPEPALTAPSS
jgi:hypothetical protein